MWSVIKETSSIIWVVCYRLTAIHFEHHRQTVRSWQFFETYGVSTWQWLAEGCRKPVLGVCVWSCNWSRSTVLVCFSTRRALHVTLSGIIYTVVVCVCVFVCLFVFDTIDAALARDKIDSLCIPLEFLKTENKGLTLILVARHRLKTKVCEHTSPVRIPLFQWLV